jgi:hypothetical protein
MQNGTKTKKIAKGHYQFTHNGEVFEIVNDAKVYWDSDMENIADLIRISRKA